MIMQATKRHKMHSTDFVSFMSDRGFKAHGCLLTVYVLFVPFCGSSGPLRPRLHGRGVDAGRVSHGRARVPDRRGVRYCTRVGGKLLPTRKPQDSANVRASVVRGMRGV